ncbi:phosphomethylpyrimidine synthase ThiC [Candidatus Poribacteria bacterium]|nr:phosphomethylpyrimidine synthase ThiC [Candidatus Poribacteria bacterium]
MKKVETQIELAKKGYISKEVKTVAIEEGISEEAIINGIVSGTIVIPYNRKHKALKNICGVGYGLRTKVNANIGTSPLECNIQTELKKLECCIKYGADSVMDLSTGGDLKKVRRKLLEVSSIIFGSVPIYQAGVQAAVIKGSVIKMTSDEIFNVIEEHAKDGVDFLTLHCGITKKTVEYMDKNERLMGVVSRGGAFLVQWIKHNEKENPLYSEFDRLLEIAKTYDITLSLGDGLRPGCLADATDIPQIEELTILGELTRRARKENVQVIIEGPGHMPMDEIQGNVMLQKKLTGGAPFYVLGPLVTDIAPGYDHITSAIGGAIAASAGADFLCYVTPSEHLSLPNEDEVKEGIMASRIAAHAADIVKKIPKAKEWDNSMAYFRKKLDWTAQADLALDPLKVKNRKIVKNKKSGKTPCTMCGEFCSMKIEDI